MKNMRRKIPIGALCLLLCGVLLLLNGCAVLTGQTATPTPSAAETTPVLLRASVTPAPTLDNEPAAVYTNVLTEKRIISLILEGYTDADTMKSITTELKDARIPAVFFISGIVANEHPDIVRLIAKQNFTIGNYGLNASKNMQDNDIPTNIHLFQRGQELLAETTGEKPTLFRCNGSDYTKEVLQAAAYVGLKAGVKPNLFLNHTSFQSYDEALSYVRKLARGSIVTIKLGQALDADEYLQTTFSMENRAIDPPPMLSDKMEDTIAATYVNIINVVNWLLQAFEDENLTIVTPEALQAQRITMFDSPAVLSAETLALVDPDAYSIPVTSDPLENVAPQTAAATAETTEAEGATPAPTDDSLAENAVFIGDSVTAGLQSYVEWRRETDPGFLGTTTFVTTTNFSVGRALMEISEDSVHPEIDGVKMTVDEALKTLDAKNVFLMPGQIDVSGYSVDQFINNLELMIYEIRTANPGINIWLESIPPGAAERYSAPTNQQIFACNLAMYKFCLQYDISFIDVAYPLRNDAGYLPDDLCIDAETYGFHLNDDGCERWLDFLRSYMPIG